MKRILLLFLLLSGLASLVQAQAPLSFNYQGVARNTLGTVINNRPIALRMSIRDLTANGTVLYSETHSINTDQYGVFALQVGRGTSVSGTFATIPWATGTKFLQVEMDPNGGTNFLQMGTSQLVSVPFALVAGGAPPIGPAGGDLLGSTYPNPLIAPLAVTTGKLADGAVTSQKITFPLVRAQADAGALVDMTNSGAGPGIAGTSTGTGFGGLFQVNNAASTADGLRATTNGTGASWAIRGISTGTNGAGLFQQTNTTNTSNNLQSNQAGLGRAGLFNSTNAASTANAVDINVAGTGFALRAASSNAVPKALLTAGGVQLTGIGEAAGRVLISDAAGNATWQSVGGSGAVTGSGTLSFLPKWTPSGSQLGNSLLFDDGTSIGLGTTTPTHRFNVVHSGSTGIGVTSTSGFSVVDIDAQSGDAALRFARAGVNQWNIRNEPGNDNLQVFELGGGGERLSIKDATGNIAIGGADGSYRLDVLHGGSTGIRSRSSSSFSVVDIDAKSGDAALRFAKDGVNQWNIRNEPGNDNLQVFELGGGGERLSIKDATGNIAIGGSDGSYRLDVLHGGSTGARIRSSASFSVVDIDAKSGDAALRFVKDGVNQWNIRNEPGTDNLQVFELGGGGERLSIKDATGNIAIGGSDGSYRLDVQHAGSTGARIRSTGSFSVVDIDGNSGDAALRFVKNGVNQWNTRNNPGTDDYQIFELGGGGERMRIDNTTGKVWVNGDFTVVGTKMFTMDHPLDPTNKTLMHAAAESNEVINFYSGNVTTNASGKATVSLPDYFEALNKDFRYQLTVVGTFAQAIISREVSNNQFEIATNQPNVKVSWEVKGVRNDAHMRKFPFVAVEEKSAAQKGKYIDPAAYNQPESKRVSYSTVAGSSLEDVAPVALPKKQATTGGSLDQTPVTQARAKAVDTEGSVANTPAAPAAAVKVADNTTGSVAPQAQKTEAKKQ